MFLFTHAHGYTQEQLSATQYLADLEIIKKQDNVENYKLDSTITRKETMKIVAKLSWKEVSTECLGIYSDVDKADWWCKYIEFAYREGFIAKNTTFRPNDSITKTEAIKLILKARWIEKSLKTDNWQADYMNTALIKWIIREEYTDYNTYALRWWIFDATTVVVKKAIKERKIEVYSDEAL